MLTDRQLMWFDEGERKSLEDWFASGNRGRPLARLVVLDTIRVRKVAEATGEGLMDQLPETGQMLMSMRDAGAALLTFVGMTALPKRREWMSQTEVNDLMLSGDPDGSDAGRALFTIGTDDSAFLYIVVNRFEVGDDGKLNWTKRLSNVLHERHVAGDPMMTGLLRGVELGRKGRAGLLELAEEHMGEALPPDMEDASVALAAAKAGASAGIRLKLRKKDAFRPIESYLLEHGVTYYEESRG